MIENISRVETRCAVSRGSFTSGAVSGASLTVAVVIGELMSCARNTLTLCKTISFFTSTTFSGGNIARTAFFRTAYIYS